MSYNTAAPSVEATSPIIPAKKATNIWWLSGGLINDYFYPLYPNKQDYGLHREIEAWEELASLKDEWFEEQPLGRLSRKRDLKWWEKAYEAQLGRLEAATTGILTPKGVAAFRRFASITAFLRLCCQQEESGTPANVVGLGELDFHPLTKPMRFLQLLLDLEQWEKLVSTRRIRKQIATKYCMFVEDPSFWFQERANLIPPPYIRTDRPVADENGNLIKGSISKKRARTEVEEMEADGVMSWMRQARSTAGKAPPPFLEDTLMKQWRRWKRCKRPWSDEGTDETEEEEEEGGGLTYDWRAGEEDRGPKRARPNYEEEEEEEGEVRGSKRARTYAEGTSTEGDDDVVFLRSRRVGLVD
ncbi:hypothetical protein ABW20_dc0110365 [Dactylellina cionopaga]|nr:hypothetical protein ABW20_dc0110365 [Dactylellina cionopaga]